MFLSISLKEPRGLILSFAKLQLYGAISMQVCDSTEAIFIFPFTFQLYSFWYMSSKVQSRFYGYLPTYFDQILDIEFGRLQARDLLQHLWTGPISNASLDVVQGGRSVEVRAVGVSKVQNLQFASTYSLLWSSVQKFFFYMLRIALISRPSYHVFWCRERLSIVSSER